MCTTKIWNMNVFNTLLPSGLCFNGLSLFKFFHLIFVTFIYILFIYTYICIIYLYIHTHFHTRALSLSVDDQYYTLYVTLGALHLGRKEVNIDGKRCLCFFFLVSPTRIWTLMLTNSLGTDIFKLSGFFIISFTPSVQLYCRIAGYESGTVLDEDYSWQLALGLNLFFLTVLTA